MGDSIIARDGDTVSFEGVTCATAEVCTDAIEAIDAPTDSVALEVECGEAGAVIVAASAVES